MIKSYNGNPRLKGVGVAIQWEEWQIKEWVKCKEDPLYFIEKYFQIVTVDHGVQLIKLWDFQKEIVKSLKDESSTIAVVARQMGKCHSKNTKYTIRNKETGEVGSISAEDFHNAILNESKPKLSILSESISRAFK